MSAEQLALDFSGPVSVQAGDGKPPLSRRVLLHAKVRCDQCRKLFQPMRSTAKFCDDTCRSLARYYRHKAYAAEAQRHEWYTPPEIVQAAREVLGGIDLDPASSDAANQTVQATQYFTVRNNGLRHPWRGRSWLNPPYGKYAAKFVEKFMAEFRAGRVTAAILLFDLAHQTSSWFHPLHDLDPIMCQPSRRLHFTNGHTERRLSAPRHSSVLLGIGVDAEAFRAAFGRFGKVWQ